MPGEVDRSAEAGESWIGRGHQALYRGIGAAGTAVVGLSAIGLSYNGLLPFSTITGMWAGADLRGVLIVAVLFSLVAAYTYSAIGCAVPRSGADYILASRVLSAPLAFTSSWVFVIISGLAAGSVAAFIPKVVLPAFGRVISANSGLAGAPEFFNLLEQPQAMALVGTLMVVGAYFSMFVPQRAFIRNLGIGVALILGAWGICMLVFALTPTGQFGLAWNRMMGAGSFEGVIPAARSEGFLAVNSLDRVILGGAILGLVVFFGFFVTTFVAGEIRKPERSIWRASGASLVIACAVLAGAATLLERMAPMQWFSAQSYLYLNAPNAGGSGAALPWIPVYAAVLLPTGGVGLILAAWIYSLVNLIQVYLFFAGRIMLAWAEDGLLPSGMAYVHPRYRSPLVSMLLAAVLVEVGLVNQLAGGFFTATSNTIYFAVVSMLAPVTAVTFFPFLKKSWYQACPPSVRRSIGPLPVISATGFVTLVYLICLIISPVWTPGGIAPTGPAEIVIFVVITVAGLVWYRVRRTVYTPDGQRKRETFKSLPSSSLE